MRGREGEKEQKDAKKKVSLSLTVNLLFVSSGHIFSFTGKNPQFSPFQGIFLWEKSLREESTASEIPGTLFP